MKLWVEQQLEQCRREVQAAIEQRLRAEGRVQLLEYMLREIAKQEAASGGVP